MTARLRLGISTCLLGENVRYDGGHKLDRFLRDTLGRYVDYVPVCPEVECGFPIPREALRLVGEADAPRLVTSKTKVDHTARMLAWANRRVAELEKENLSGFIFKTGSPSSGLMRVKVYHESGGPPVKNGVGIFARALTEHFPRMPVEDDGRMNDPALRENFIERIFTYHRLQELVGGAKTRGGLVDFHSRQKLLILSHSPKHYKEMGKLVAGAKTMGVAQLFDAYERLLMEALALKGTPAKHGNVLLHMLGYFKKQLSPDEKQEVLEVIGRYRQSLVPLIVPITLLNHYVRKYGQTYLAQQYYLNPHPVELKLRNHA